MKFKKAKKISESLENLLKRFKESGGRITNQRKLVLKSLLAASLPLNAYQIADNISCEGFTIDVSTVYRSLEIFKESGLVHFIESLQKYAVCEMPECSDDDHCHHQFICNECEKSFEFHIDDNRILRKVASAYKEFKIKAHSFSFSGVCDGCQLLFKIKL